MEQKKIDYLIVGQGIAGSWLAYELLNRSCNIIIFNNEKGNSASLKAAGLYNPITGRKMVKTWLADLLFKDLEKKYEELALLVNKQFLHQTPIYRPFTSAEEVNDWEGKMGDSSFSAYIKDVSKSSLNYAGFLDTLGGIIIKKAGYIDLPLFIQSIRELFLNKGIYHNNFFDCSKLIIKEDSVEYELFEAKKIIFCEGPVENNPFWSDLPFKNVRGEVIDISCEIQTDYIINRGVFMIPKNGFYTVGSTYDHKVLSFEPQKEGIDNLVSRLDKLFNGSYSIIDQRAGVRPSTFDRKPFIGLHKKFKTLGIFNGFGTKGVSLTPFFASQYAEFLLGRSEIEKEADVQRVY